MKNNVVRNLGIAAVAVLVVAAIVLTSLAIVGQYSKVLRTNTAVDNVSTTLLNGTNVRVGSANQYPFLQTSTSCVNSSNAALSLTADKYTVIEGGTGGGFMKLDATETTWNGTAVNCSITYLADSTAQGTADLFTTGLRYFGTFIGIVVLALIGVAIISLFKKK